MLCIQVDFFMPGLGVERSIARRGDDDVDCRRMIHRLATAGLDRA